MRWRIAVLVSVAIAISYLDRQTLPVAIKAIEREIPVTNQGTRADEVDEVIRAHQQLGPAPVDVGAGPGDGAMIGIAGDRYFEVLSGVKPGDQVVTGPYNSVRGINDGDPVKVDTGGKSAKAPAKTS